MTIFEKPSSAESVPFSSRREDNIKLRERGHQNVLVWFVQSNDLAATDNSRLVLHYYKKHQWENAKKISLANSSIILISGYFNKIIH